MAGDTMTQEMICRKARMFHENLKKNVAGQNTAEKLFSRNLREITFRLTEISNNECDSGTNYLL